MSGEAAVGLRGTLNLLLHRLCVSLACFRGIGCALVSNPRAPKRSPPPSQVKLRLAGTSGGGPRGFGGGAADHSPNSMIYLMDEWISQWLALL